MSHKLQPRRLRHAFGHFATGIAIMTARRDDHTILIGRVHDLDEHEGEPLLFYRGRLNRLLDLGERLR